MFEWFENTALAIWVGESLWGYPLMLSLHVIGLAIVAGIFTMLNLRLLGTFRGIPFAVFRPLIQFAWVGFAINLLSGLALFASQATVFVESKPFLIKIAAIIVAMFCSVYVQNHTAARAGHGDDETQGADGALRAIATISLLLWLTAICAGRLIAYL